MTIATFSLVGLCSYVAKVKVLTLYYCIIVVDLSRDSYIKSPAMPMPKEEMSLDKGNTITDSKVANQDMKIDILEDKNYQPESNTNSTAV